MYDVVSQLENKILPIPDCIPYEIGFHLPLFNCRMIVLKIIDIIHNVT